MAAPLTCWTPHKQRWRTEPEALVQMRHTKATCKQNKKLAVKLNVYPARKAASAMIAKIPLVLSRHIARVYHPDH